MKTGKSLSFVRNTGIFGLLILMAACHRDKTDDPFAAVNFNPYDQKLGKRIEAYQHTIARDNANSKSGNPALYIDFSSGINKAFADPVIQEMMMNCFNTVLSQKFDVYKLGSNKITRLNITNTTELGQQINNPAQYADIWAPIQSAVEKIVNNNNDALLITDFEEWQKNIEVTNTAFLKLPFSKWLEKGNTIHFFIADYKEGKVNKHLYFTVFNAGNPNESSMISKLESKLEAFTTRFDLSDKSYKLRTAYPGEQSGGVFYDVNGKSDNAKNVLDLKTNYINGLKNGNHFEFYPLGVDWKTIAELHTTYSGEKQFNDFFRNLFIDLSNDDSYNFGDFDVKVSDVTADFENFSRADEAKKHHPKLAKGSNGEIRFADNETDLIALTCYNTDGKLKEQWSYKPVSAISVNQVFTLNQPLFKNTRTADHKNAELAVSFHPEFKLKNIPNPGGIIKVDIVLNTATPNSGDTKLSKFKWVNGRQVANIALHESIKNTLQELKPVHQIVYSYYIKTQQ
jgi:hypothetical protein